MKFTCKKCGASGLDKIEVIQTDICLTCNLSFTGNECEVGETTEILGGTIDRFQCKECGMIIPTDEKTTESLAEYLCK